MFVFYRSMGTMPNRDVFFTEIKPDQCDQLTSLSTSQRVLCRTYIDHMRFVSSGAVTGINECKWQFKNERWNCTTVDDDSVFGKVVDIGKFGYNICRSYFSRSDIPF